MAKTAATKKETKQKTYVDPGAPKNPAMQQKCVILGQNIRRERKNRNFTMEELVNMVDISESYLGLLERGKRTPSLECLFDFCNTFGITPNDLLLQSNKGGTKKLVVNDPSVNSGSDNYSAALSLLRSLNEAELEYIVSAMLSLKKMTRGNK